MLKELKKDKKVFVAMSGGIDSSAAALLLKKQGYEVVGVFMKFWHEASTRENCCSKEARRDAMRVCAKLNIPFLTWNFQKEFKKKVVDDFITGYKKGITPNPCIICNKEIKFGLFLKKALAWGADYIATGHYVKIQNSKTKIQNNNSKLKIVYKLFAAKDRNKDQSYFLWTLTQKQLKYCLFPIGDYLKKEVRMLAKRYRLPVNLNKESQEVCFVKDANLHAFLRARINTKKGEIIELKTNKKIGEHQGVQFYTIGQKVPIGGSGPYYVIKKDLKKNQLLVGKRDDKDSFLKEIKLKNINWIAGKPPEVKEVLVRTRYRQLLSAATPINTGLFFKKPLQFIAPGQSAVFYSRKGELLGGGIIV